MNAVVVLASHNAKKAKELAAIVAGAGLPITVRTLADYEAYPEPKENGASFAENALIKARAAAAHTGQVALADDSGLCVAALNEMPGIFSARWAGGHGNDQANLDLVLAQLADVPAARRQAAFVSVCALVHPDGQEEVVEGRWEGRLLTAEAGEGGFGYDPIFVPHEEDTAGTGRTSAEMSAAEKNALSHRHKALVQLVPHLAALAS
ncbi:MAG: RdgB/HAM1 family non-canonical purine NTP pyrophosphatase [Corynebacterium sp.]|nr:RdgB/HAM1 family non-canonical purine NTP pyrophosphatase [Corynebacterium sp.]